MNHLFTQYEGAIVVQYKEEDKTAIAFLGIITAIDDGPTEDEALVDIDVMQLIRITDNGVPTSIFEKKLHPDYYKELNNQLVKLMDNILSKANRGIFSSVDEMMNVVKTMHPYMRCVYSVKPSFFSKLLHRMSFGMLGSAKQKDYMVPGVYLSGEHIQYKQIKATLADLQELKVLKYVEDVATSVIK